MTIFTLHQELRKKVCVWVLGRGAHSKSKLHSPPLADCNEKSINTFAMCLGKQMGGSTQYLYLSWSQTFESSHGQLECHFTQWKRTRIQEAEPYHLDIGVSSIKCHDSDTVEFNKRLEDFLLRYRCNYVCSGRGRHFCKPSFAPLCH